MSDVNQISKFQYYKNDFGGVFSEYGLTYKILNNFDALENQN